MGMFSVKVINKKDYPVEGARVSVHYGTWQGQDEKYTGSNGWAEFSNLDGTLVSGEFYVDSVPFGTHSTETGAKYYFTV